jgi:Na+/proline symporter
MDTVTLVIGVYLVIQLGIGVYAARGVGTEADYVVAGRSVGLVLGMFSMFATNFGAETVIGSSAAVAADGLAGGRADPFGYTICWTLMAIFVAYQLRSREYVTVGDFFRERYGVAIEKLVVVIMVPGSLIWAAAQMMAFGQILSVVSHIAVGHAIIIATTLIVIYTTIGGMKGDILTDFVQSIVIIVGLALLGWFVMRHAGGFGASIATIRPEQLHFTRPGESLLKRLDVWMIPILGSLVMQEAAGRILSMKSPAMARRAAFGSAAIYLVVGLIPVYIALVGAHFDFTIAHRDEYLPNLAQRLLPLPLFIVFIAALVSAILSTVNSTLLAFATLTSQNLLFPAMKNLTERREILITRGLVLLAGPFTCLLALGGENIFEMAQLSSSLGLAGVLTAFFAGLWVKRGGALAAGLGLVTGMTVSLLGSVAFDEAWDAPFLYSVAAAIAAHAVGIGVERSGMVARVARLPFSRHS